ncbi:jg1830 [Pararge aegeria aegeria]|uniref:Jg1830 protein n=1 Tax=Pararge aegeria aegeria TaxID=348720 RepID=A0A8S4SEP3_9NEOP|nr:jg1830 [Pararge aegeria aegeria]
MAPRQIKWQSNEVSDWGAANLVKFHATKTQACLFTAKRSPFPLTLTFVGKSLSITDSVEFLGVNISSNLNFGSNIEFKAGKKLGILNKVKRYFTPEQLVPSSSPIVHGVLYPFMG